MGANWRIRILIHVRSLTKLFSVCFYVSAFLLSLIQLNTLKLLWTAGVGDQKSQGNTEHCLQVTKGYPSPGQSSFFVEGATLQSLSSRTVLLTHCYISQSSWIQLISLLYIILKSRKIHFGSSVTSGDSMVWIQFNGYFLEGKVSLKMNKMSIMF